MGDGGKDLLGNIPSASVPPRASKAPFEKSTYYRQKKMSVMCMRKNNRELTFGPSQVGHSSISNQNGVCQFPCPPSLVISKVALTSSGNVNSLSVADVSDPDSFAAVRAIVVDRGEQCANESTVGVCLATCTSLAILKVVGSTANNIIIERSC